MADPVKRNALRGKGLNTVFSGELSLLGLDLLVLEANESFELDTGEFETAVVPLRADVSVTADAFAYRLKRDGVFSSKASSVCLPRETRAGITASAYSELALCKARTGERRAPFFVPPERVREKTVGRDIWERKVVDIIGPEENASRIVLGETFNRRGGWSSFPPHKHDTPVPGQEVRMEEIYLFRFDPAEGFGTQTVYGKGGRFSFMVRDYDAVTIPWGYHPVSAMPGHSLYYLWFLAGDGRTLCPNTDPDFKWLEVK